MSHLFQLLYARSRKANSDSHICGSSLGLLCLMGLTLSTWKTSNLEKVPTTVHFNSKPRVTVSHFFPLVLIFLLAFDSREKKNYRPLNKLEKKKSQALFCVVFSSVHRKYQGKRGNMGSDCCVVTPPPPCTNEA